MLKKKHGSGLATSVQLSAVVTPMLDMTFQLLFFFVLTFKPASVMEGKMDFNLPASGEARAKMQEDVNPDKPSDDALALPAQLTVLIKTLRDGTNDGNISAIIVKSVDGETALPNIEALEKYLKSKHEDAGLSNKDDIKIEAESKLKYACVIDVMDACLKAGFKSVGFSPPPDLTAN